MPTYEYACTACGHRLEAVQSFSDDPLTECPECGAPLRKVYGNVGIVLKGSGFYKTDSRAASGANGAGQESREGHGRHRGGGVDALEGELEGDLEGDLDGVRQRLGCRKQACRHRRQLRVNRR